MTADALQLTLADGREVSAPLFWFPRLLAATETERQHWRLIGAGEGVHWPAIDEDVSVASLLRLD
ncbi:MAG TPA: DUF2442 domain-containing protein [Terrimesophilobacter sp.]|nr:DUF2442 domain-containing protein [Terrimesophilobacter sp.]